MKRPWIAALVVATILITFRIFTANHLELSNYAPVVAMLFCGAAFWKTNRWVLLTALLAWIVSWPLVSMAQGYSPFHLATFSTLISFGIVIYIGRYFMGKSSLSMISGTLIGATAFYLITNTVSFMMDPQYSKSIEGFLQCMWTGSPVSATPTWMFFRNSLIGNTVGTLTFLAIMHLPVIRKATLFTLADRQQQF